jgi:hypothetical protein
MILRPDRRRRGPDPVLGPKMLFFVVGAVLGILGIGLDLAWLTYLGVVVLVLGLLLRFLPGRGAAPEYDPDDDESAPGDPADHEPAPDDPADHEPRL